MVAESFFSKKIPAGSALYIATSQVPTVRPDDTVSTIRESLIKNISDFESVNYLYVLDKGFLQGIISIKEIFRQPDNKPVSDFMKTDLVVVYPHTSQQRAAMLALKNNLKAVPVVDKKNIFQGVIVSDVVLSVLYSVGQKNVMHLAGMPAVASQKTILDFSLLTLFLHRLPWLLLGLGGGLIGAKIISLFSATIEAKIILVSFIPLVLYMGGSVLAQTQAFFIRDLALQPDLIFKKYVIKQLQLVGLIALTISAVIWAVIVGLYNDFFLGKVLAIALLGVIVSTVITGLFIPYLFYKFKFDPADGSGPLATVLQDIMGVIVYFLVALLFI